MKPTQITFAVQAAGPVRTETLMGREYRVIPGVLVQEQVLHNNLGSTYLPADEIAASVEAWNGIPVVLRHPQSRGAPVSARSPEVLNSRGAGFLFHSKFADNALKADVYIDIGRASDLPDVGAVVNAVDAGKTGELSTGFGCNIEKVPGTFNGTKYDVILRNIQPDHLALLPDEIGACSVSDGCGLARNHAGSCDAQNAEPVSTTVENELPAPPAVDVAAKDQPWRKFIAAAARFLGFGRAENESDEDRRHALSIALRAKFGGDDRFVWVDAVFSEEGIVVYEVEVADGGEGGGLFRSTFEVAEDGTVTFGEPDKVRRVTAFEPVANAGDHSEEGNTMDRTKMIAQLVAAGPLGEDALNKLSDCQLRALAGANGGTGGDQVANQTGSTATMQALQETNLRYRAEIDELRAQTANALATEERERVQLMEDVLYARNRTFSDEEVRAMDIVMLRKVHGIVCPPRQDYTGRGGPRAGNTSGPSLDFVSSIMDGPRGQSVLDAREVN